MHQHDLSPFAHPHEFGDARAGRRERALMQVTWLTLTAMVIELVVGYWSRSLALTADGWHMGTHALALGGAALAYRLSARANEIDDGRYPFGGWKIEVLAAYTSALALGGVALMLVVDAVQALHTPRPIAYIEAMVVASVGLFVNAASAWLLTRDDAQGHDHAHGHPHPHGHDHNFKAAYLHVLADALTSVLAIVALAGGYWFGWGWLDPLVALLGAALIGNWAVKLVLSSAGALVDARADPALESRIRCAIESDGDARLADLHLWQVGGHAWSAVLTVVADRPLPTGDYRARIAGIDGLGHVTVEVRRCPGPAPGGADA